MQMALVRDRVRDYGASQASLLLKPSGHVGGDLVGTFDAGENVVALYAIDVSGHGIASALLTARVAGYLSNGAPEQNIALERAESGEYRRRPPHDVALALNKLMVSEVKSDLYFTMSLAYVDQTTGRVEITQCGHPNPAILSPDGRVRFHGSGGLPIGLVTDATYETASFDLAPGERLVLYSDGFTESRDASGAELEEDGFAALLSKNAGLRGQEFFEALTWDLDYFTDGPTMPDDISSVVFDYRGWAPVR